MTFLTQRCDHVIEQIGDLNRLREIARSQDDFARRRDQLVGEQKALEPLAAQVRLFRAHGLIVTVPPLVGLLQGNFRQLRDNYKAHPESLTRANLSQVSRQSQQCQHALKEELERIWQDYVDAKRLRIDDGLLSLLGEVPAYRDAVTNLQDFDEQVETLRAATPRSDAAFGTLEHTIGEMQRIWNGLKGAGLPSEVTDFLRIAGDKRIGARLDLLDKIRPWLKERGLEDSFRVIISG